MLGNNVPAMEESNGNVLLRIRVQPRASRAGLRLSEDGVYRVSVTAPPVDDAANHAVCAYLSKLLGIAKRNITITAGDHSRTKTVCIANIGMSETLDKLRGHINE